MSLPLVSQPGESDSVQLGQNVCVFKVKGEHTDEQFGLFELTMQPGSGGPRPHIHKQMTEIFYVVEGEVELTLDEEKVTAQPGAVMVVPQSIPHAFANPGQTQSKLLIMFCPAKSREKYFEGLAELTKDGRQASEQELLELMHQFDQYLVPGS